MVQELCYRNNTNSLFRKYAKLVTWFANTGIGSDYLGTPKSKISLLLPNGYSEWGGGRSFRSTFSTRPIYAPKLYPALQIVDLCHNWLKDFDEAKTLLAWQLGLTRRQPAIATNLLFATTSTFYSTAGGDGNVRNSNATWSTARNAADGDDVQKTALSESCGIYFTGSGSYYIYRIFLPFVTSALPDTDTVDSTTLNVTPTNKNGSNYTFAIVQTSQASSTDLVLGDFDQCGAVDSPTEGATRVSVNDMTNETEKGFPLNATGLTWISKTGTTLLGLRQGTNDIDNSAPAGHVYTNFYFNEQGTPKYPNLVVVHSAAGVNEAAWARLPEVPFRSFAEHRVINY